MSKQQDVQGQLSDTQESLAAALAQIQALRLRQRALERTNVKLRNALRKHGVNPSDYESELEEDALRIAQPLDGAADSSRYQSPSASPEGSSLAVRGSHAQQSELEELLHQVQPRPVALITEHGKVPGYAFVSDDVIEFIEVKARVTPEDFVGVRFFVGADTQVSDWTLVNGQQTPAGSSSHKRKAKKATNDSGGSNSRSALARPSWWDSLFGKGDDAAGQSPPTRHSSLTQPQAWQSRPKPRSQSPAPAEPLRGPEAGGAPSALHVPTLAEGLSALSTLTDYLQANLLGDGDGGVAPEGAAQGGAKQLLTGGTEAGVPQERAGATEGRGDDDESGAWQMIWKGGGGTGELRTVIFQAAADTRGAIQRKVEQWGDRLSGSTAAPSCRTSSAASPDGAQRTATAAPRSGSPPGAATEHALVAPEHLVTTQTFTPQGCAESAIMSARMAAAVAATLPGRLKLSNWKQLYSTESGGFSLQTLYRAGARCARSLLVVEDFSGHVFGAFCTEAWRVNPRYQGTGECFVFQLRPHLIKYGWQQPAPGQPRNDFFMLLAADSIGIGGGPHFAIWLDSDLLHGNSGLCSTFGSPVLSGAEDYKVKALELWQVGL